MADIDPDTLLEWLTMGTGEERDMQVIALEQLCMLLLMSDNVDRCFESCPPRSFLPALCHIFMDETAPDSILEVTARAITYYLDVSAECSRRIVTVDGAIKALCTRLVVVDISARTSKDLAEQCVKVLELMCTREANAIYEAGGLNCMLTFIREHGTQIHKDTLHSAMSVVARLCSKMEPTDETLETCMDSLSKLLQHEDTYVADTALKCFACLADRFTRRGVDPAPLAKHGLTEELLKKLVSSALACNLNASNNLNASMSESRSSSGNVSIIVSVLSMLCRGSPSVTHDLLRSSLPNAIETAMQGDERCVLDTMRLVDLLLILLFEGRDALPKSVLSSKHGSIATTRSKQTTQSGEKSHRQLIDCIRSKDTDALVEAVVSSTFDVNFMDDVGQTLLNWASAFGTLEMVEFLCERGADVNRGQRSSSLHYAACFGRPAVVKVLLKHGANPELRDEDGKTPLDKARERNEEGHKEVVQILQSPGEWMAVTVDPASNDKTEEALNSENNENREASNESKEDPEKKEEPERVVKGDPEMALKYVKHLVPVFAHTYQGSLLHSIKKATLAILKKMIHYIPASMMEELVSHNVASQLVDVIAVALNSEDDDDDGRLVAFHCVQNLMSKNPNVFLIHFIRLGVLQRITEMVNESEEMEIDEIIEGKMAKKDSTSSSLDDATKICSGQPYHWHDWCIVRGRDCLYLWSDFCAIELSNGSNGWFRFVLDGKLATMYSSGSPEGGSSSSESRTEFLDKLQRARSAVPPTQMSRPILSNSSAKKITVGNWTLSCRSERELAIINVDGQQATILKEDLPGFLFESNRGTKHTFTAETSLGADFAYSWNGKPGRKYQSKKDQIKQNLATVARNLYCKYFKDVDLTPHGSMAALHKISEVLSRHAQHNETFSEESREEIYVALKDLYKLLEEESMLSSYEIQTSGLVLALSNCLNKGLSHPSHTSISMLKEPCHSSETFKKVFGETVNLLTHNNSVTSTSSPAIVLVQKLVMVLESCEKLPVLTYEGLGGGTGLQILLRRLRFKLERGNKSTNFIDRSGRCIKMEPLFTVREVERYLLRTVAKQWFDYDRETFKFVQHFKNNGEPLVFNYVSDFDDNGIVYWIGTNGKTISDWTNPARHGIVQVTSSEGRSLPYGRLEDVISRESQAENCHTNDDKSAWFGIDLGVYVIPSKYTLRHSRGYGSSALRTWLFQASNDGNDWKTLKSHSVDESLNEPSSTASWEIPEDAVSGESKGWHLFRIQQNGSNASGQTFYLSVSGFEVYGKVTDALDKMEVINHGENDNAQKRQRRVFRSQILRHMALGSKDSNDWKLLGEQARAKALLNEKKKTGDKGWVNVSWPNNNADAKTNAENDFNMKVVDISDPDVQAAMFEVEKKEKNKNNKARSQSTLDNALRQVVMSFGKQKSKSSDNTNKPSENPPQNVDDNQSADVCSNSRIDLANLQFLMAVEDLLDSPSSDLVASALAEAASMHVDQLRLATRSFRSTLLASTKSRPTPSAQGSRESQSPPVELHSSSVHETFEKTEELEKNVENTQLDTETLENIQEESDSNDRNEKTEGKVDTSKELTKEERMSQIQKVITSSMSDVLDSMHADDDECNFDNFGNGNDEFEEDEFHDNLSVAENNFLNDNHTALEPSVISILNSAADIECCSSDDEDFQGQLDIQRTPTIEKPGDYQLLSNENPLEKSSELIDTPTVEIESTNKTESNDERGNRDSVSNKLINTNIESVEVGIIIDETINSNEQLETFETERLQSELDTLKNEISTMRNEFEKIESCVGRIETSVEEMSNNLETFQDEVNELSEQISTVEGSEESSNSVNLEEVINNENKKQLEKLSNDNASISSGRTADSETDDSGEISSMSESMMKKTDEKETAQTICNDVNVEEARTEEVSSNESIENLIASNEQGLDTGNSSETGKSSASEQADARSSKRKRGDDGMFSLEEILEVHNLKEDGESRTAANESETKAGDENQKIDDCDREDVKEDTEGYDMDYMDIDDGGDDDDDDGDDDDDDEFDDIENEDENEAHDVYEPSNVHHERHYDHQRRMWDDDLILKCQHDALVPAFDPRPGRTNVQQTQDIEIPTSDKDQQKQKKKQENNIRLYLRGAPYPGAKEVEILLDNPQATVFSYVQALVLHGMSGTNRSERLRRVWEPTYTIVYKSTEQDATEDEIGSGPPTETDVLKWSFAYVKENLGTMLLPKSDLINYLQENGPTEFLKKWKLTGTTKICRKQRNCTTLISAYKEFAELKMTEAINQPREYKEKVFQIEEPVHSSLDEISPIQQVLDVLKALYRLSEESADETSLSEKYLFNVSNDEFLSKKLTNKLIQQIQDPLALASGSLPLWCEYLVINYPTLFPFETRQMFFRATSFGCSRSIVWLQNMQDANLERARGHPTRRLETTEFRIGRLKHERVTVPRGDDLLNTAIRLMNFHAERKAVLEIEFQDEEGTGLGPSLEFYALISLAIQRNDLSLWVSMDEATHSDDTDYSETLNKYSRHPNGLFPAPLPQDSENMDEICQLFSFLGIFLAKCVQDNRLVDIPLSEPFFKMLCAGKGKYAKLSRTLSQTSEMVSECSVFDDDDGTSSVDASVTTSVEKLDAHYFSDVLTEKDFSLIHPHKAKFMEHLKTFISKRDTILSDDTLKYEERTEKLENLMFVTEHGHECKLEDLGLTFQYIPSSSVYGFDAVDLQPGGSDKILNGENVEEYMELLIDFTMHKGIAKQLEAFRAGFNRVFPMEKLHAFKSHEIRLMLCGEQSPQWTYDELMMYTEPKYGYHKDSPGFRRLINVLAEMTGSERKAFLQFSTGCSSLPPGGIANLHPRLTVVKKDEEGDNSFPSVNTCVHYLKLPEYSSEEVLKEKLLAATKEKGFHLN